jgi:RimJ/RimL family protein N-acetyltransferase
VGEARTVDPVSAGSSRPFVIRPATPGDAPALVALARAVGSEPEGWLIADSTWRSVGEERRYLRALKRYRHAAVLVAETPAEIVGRLSIARDPHPASWHVADVGLMVAAGHRRRGIGRALLSSAVDWAQKAGVTKLELHVFPHNDAGIALYESFGFVREGYRRRHYRRGREYVDAILMAFYPGEPPEGPAWTHDG